MSIRMKSKDMDNTSHKPEVKRVISIVNIDYGYHTVLLSANMKKI